MTKEHLKKILNSIFHLPVDDKAVESLFDPDYKTEYINLYRLNLIKNKALCFDFCYHGLQFVSGSISCSGVELEFKSERFKVVSVRILFDYRTRQIYNSVLAIPEYTEKDWLGKKNIKQVANTVRSDKDLERYFKKMYSRFECPVQIKSNHHGQ